MDELTQDFLLAKEGDKAAFARLQQTMRQPLAQYVRRLTGSEDRVDDVLQDAFVALYMNIERVDPVENVRPFLYRIVRNLCYDEFRKRGRYDMGSWDSSNRYADASRHTPAVPIHERLHWCLLYEGVQEAIDQLPERQRGVMLLYCEERFTYEQMAQALGVSMGTVKSRMYYARANLVKILGPQTLYGLGLEQIADEGDEA